MKFFLPAPALDQHCTRAHWFDKLNGPARSAGNTPADHFTTEPLKEGAAMPNQSTASGFLGYRDCERCSKPFSLMRRHAAKRFCSISCARKTLPTPAPKNCARCGVPFQPTAKYPQQRFCSCGCGFKATNPPDHNARVSRSSAKNRGNKLRGRGAGRSYPKLNGRHAHRVIAEQVIGRELKPGEVVHHKDEIKTNYAPGNLDVLPSQAEHASIHFKGVRKSPEHVAKMVASRKATMAARKAGAR